MPLLESGISKNYYKDFILEEDSLRRIQAILEKAGKELPDSVVVVFRIEKEDDRFYETLAVEDVLADPNIKGRRVEEVHVQLRPTDEHSEYEISIRRSIANLKFSSVGNVTLQISHDNRNWALLLADEIEPQIQRTFKARGFPRWVLSLFSIPAGLLTFKLSQMIFPDQILTSHLGNAIGITLGLLFSTFFFLGMPSFRVDRHTRLSILGGPVSVFLWGDEVHTYNQLLQTRQNVLWGAVVAFLISFVSGGLWLLF